MWSFTVVRRVQPTTGERNSAYRYLAPLNADQNRKGGVLRFSAENLNIKPDKNIAYKNSLNYGSLIKLYEYEYSGSSNILLGGGLLRQVDVRLPSPALPVMFHECRKGKSGHDGSFSNPCTGLMVRLADNVAGNVEDGFPLDTVTSVQGQEFSIRFFGFKNKKAKTYITKNNGVLFVVNGQTQGMFPSRFYKQNDIKLDYVADSLITRVDCSKLDRWAHEDLFMNTRESLADSEFRKEVEKELKKEIGKNSRLKDFNRKRRDEMVTEKTEDDKPLEEALQNVMKNSPVLNSLFLSGKKLVDSTKSKPVSDQPNFEGKEFPTFFKFRNLKQGEILNRDSEEGRDIILKFDTDVEDNYFGRLKERGTHSVSLIEENGQVINTFTGGINLDRGTATLRIVMSKYKIGEKLTIRIEVGHESIINPFINEANVTIIPFVENKASGKGKKRKPLGDEGEGLFAPSGISFPKIVKVSESQWEDYEFTKHTALKVKKTNQENDLSNQVYDFFVNVDNFYLGQEIQKAHNEEKLLREQFVLGLVLLGLALIHEVGRNDDGQYDVEDIVESATSALAIVLIPMIKPMLALEFENLKDLN